MPMLLTREKLERRIPDLIAATIREQVVVGPVFACPAPGDPHDNAMSPPPAADVAAWRELPLGASWGGDPARPGEVTDRIGWGIPADAGHNHWLKARFAVPDAWRGRNVLLHLTWDGGGQSSVEAILYIDGATVAGIDEPHPSAVLPLELHDGEHEAIFRCYAPYAIPFKGLRLQLRDETMMRMAAAMYALHGAHETYRDSDPQKQAILLAMNDAYTALDLTEGWGSERLAASAQTAWAGLSATLDALGQREPQHGNGQIGARPPQIMATGHAHMDVAWLWPLWRTRQKIAHTVATALALMDRYPEYHFSMSQPQTYAYLKQDDPALYARMVERIREGRFEPVGQMWLEPDCNVTGGESLARQLIHGGRFFEQEFGAMQHVVWLPDVFGYSAALPQLMRLAGIKCFMTTKISWNQFNRMPCDTFRWRGIDGSEVIAHFVTATADQPKHAAEAQFYTYNGDMSPQQVYGTWNHYRQKAVSDEVLYIYGYGDGGGGPVEGMLELARVMGNLPGFPQVKNGRIEQFFERLYERAWDNPQTPAWVGELYLEFHRGTYTSQGRTKQNNRKAELDLREAEWLNAWATLGGAPNQQPQLDAQWQTVLLNQFHDILPGSSVPMVYSDSEAQFAVVHEEVAGVRERAAGALLESDVSDDAGKKAKKGKKSKRAGLLPYTVFNSLPWERSEVVELPGAADADGTERAETFDGAVTLAELSAPSYGYAPAVLREARDGVSVSKETIENNELRLTLDDHGELASVYDKRFGREVVLPGSTANQLIAFEDRSLFWSAWDIDAFYEEKPYPVRDVSGRSVAAGGGLRGAIELTRRFNKTTIRQQIRLHRGSRRIDFVTDVDWQEREVLLRAHFPLHVNATRATCEIQFGAVERPTHRNTSWDWARFEVCAQRWVDLSEGDYGAALLNNGKYGHSLHDTTLGLSLLKGAVHPDPLADVGKHRFTYSLLPHGGDWRQGEVTRRAYELNAPLRVVAGEAGGAQSLLSCDAANVVVETVKVAHDGDGLIVRLYEAHNGRSTATLSFDRKVRGAVETDLMEREIGAVDIGKQSVTVDLRPFEVKTIRVRL